MRLGLRLLLGFFLIVGLATFFVLRVFVNEVKPGVRQAMESTLVDAANVLAVMAAPDLKAGQLAEGRFVRDWTAAQRRDLRARVWQFPKRSIAYQLSITDARGVVVYDSLGRDVGRDNSRWNDVYRTLRGEYGARSSHEDPTDGGGRGTRSGRERDDGGTVMHVAAPIYDPDEATEPAQLGGARDPGPAATASSAPARPRRIIGVLTLSQPNRTFEPYIVASQHNIIRRGGWLIGLSALIAALMTWWLIAGIRGLNRYAQAVAAGERVPPPPARRDELGDLGRALEDMRRKLEGRAYAEHYVQSLTHELKAPLAAIRGAAELLQEALPEAERQRFAHNIQTQERRLTETIEQLLALASVEQHGWLQHVEDVDLDALLAGAAEDVAPQLAASGVTLAIEGALTAPAARVLRGDAYLLRQAVTNLLDNAIAFSAPGDEITVSCTREVDSGGPPMILLTVADRGPGVPDYAQPRVFERFYSLPRPSSGRKSSGLGLPFVREVARLHGGTAELRCRPGGGTEARLRLPA